MSFTRENEFAYNGNLATRRAATGASNQQEPAGLPELEFLPMARKDLAFILQDSKCQAHRLREAIDKECGGLETVPVIPVNSIKSAGPLMSRILSRRPEIRQERRTQKCIPERAGGVQACAVANSN
jgi:hypothetical protein